MNRLSSTRLRLEPRPPILISSSAVTASLSSPLGSGPQHGLHDVLVPGAAAQVAGERPPHLVLARARVVVEEGLGREHHPWRAEPALQAVRVFEALLDRVELARRRE